MKLKKCVGIFLFSTLCLNVGAIDHKRITFDRLAPDRFTLMENGVANEILVDEQEDAGVMIAVRNLQNDFKRVSGRAAGLCYTPGVKRMIMVGTLKSRYIRELVKAKKIDASLLEGKNEKYLMTVVSAPLNGVNEALVIAGSDKRGTIYGIYELSEQIGVSPWYDWADVPVMPRQNLSMMRGSYTAGEPAVKYRGIFLNDEAPCLTGWVKHTYGTNYGDHRFYARVFELILRLRGNFMWPAMWGWSFYADDPENSKTAHEMGIIMGTSHHEPMARNHQEWVRKRSEYGAWDYASNQQVIDRFFREGMERAADTEDLITIGMRGDGDTPMGGKEGEDDKYVPRDEENMRLMEKIFRNQRRIIKEVTGKAPEKRPQVWAIYKEVQRYYDMGLRVPDDVIMLLSDDNWGDVRRLPDAKERKHSGGWGMYYHVDYVGAPRNSKWLNVTPVQNMWGLGQQGSEPLAIGGSAGEGGDFGPHQGEDLLGHLGAAQVEGPLVLQHMAGHAPPSLRLDAGHLPVDVFVGLLQRRVLCFLKAELPAALDLREGALALVGGFRQDFGGEAVQLLIHIRHS